jgi:hypothetical protein
MTTRTEPAVLLAAPAGLIVARVIGLDVVAVWCAFAVCVLLPGWGALRLLRVERELGLAGSAPAAAALGLAVWTPPLAAAFIAHLSLGVPLVVVLAAGAVLCGVALVRPPLLERAPWWEVAAGTLAAGAFAFLAWRLSTGVISDALFHVGRMRKIEDIGSLSLTSISSYQDGPPHAGYAFPLLHAAFAGVARVAGVDVATAFIYLQPLCAFLAMLGAYAFARSLTGWRTAGYLAAVLLAWDLCTLLNGLVMQINQPPVFAFFVLTPGALMLFVAALRGSRSAAWGSMAAVGVISLVHPTYAVPCLAIAAGMAVGSWRAHMRMPPIALEALATSVVVSGLVAGWIWWVAIDGGHRRAVITHADEFVHRDAHAYLMYPWAPVFGRGYVLVAVLALVLLVRYRDLLPAAGAMLGLLFVLLVPGVNTAVIAVVGMGQFHRFWQVLPWPEVLAAAACVAASWLGARRGVAAALALALVLYRLRGIGHFWREPTSVLVVLGLLAVAVALVPRPRRMVDRGAAWVAALLVAAVLFAPIHHGGKRVLDSARAGPHRTPRSDLVTQLTPDVPRYFRRLVGPAPVVLGEEHRVFELVAYANVYAAALPEARSRAEPKVDTTDRLGDEKRFFDAATTIAARSEILARWNVDYVLVDLRDQAAIAPAILGQPGLRVVYRGPRFVILRVTR